MTTDSALEETSSRWSVRPHAVRHARRAVFILGPLLGLFAARRDVVRELLTLRLLLDEGDAGAGAAPGRLGNKGRRWLLAFLAVLGLAFGLGAFPARSAYHWLLLTETFALMLVLLQGMPLVGRLFTDQVDLSLVAARPVEGRSLLLARLLHLLLTFVVPALVFTTPAAILGSVRWAAPWLLVVVPLATLSTVWVGLGTALVLHSCSQRLGGPQRRSQVALWTTVVLGVVLVLPAQLLPLLRLKPSVLAESALIWAFPPAHAASLVTLLPGLPAPAGGSNPWLEGGAGDLGVPGVALALLLPLLAMAMVVGLNRRLILTVDPPGGRPVRKAQAHWPELPWFTAGMDRAQERAGFGLGWSLALRDTVFLQAVLPVSFMLMLPALMNVAQGALLNDFSSGSNGGSLVMLAPYTCAILIALLIHGSRHGQLSESSWIFDVTPLRRSGLLIRGCATAILVRMYAGALLLIVLAVVATLGAGWLPQLLLAGCMGLFLGLAGTSWMKLSLPFSKPAPRRGSAANNTLKTLFLALVLLATGLMQGELMQQLPDEGVTRFAVAVALSLVSLAGVRWAYRRLGWVTAA